MDPTKPDHSRDGDGIQKHGEQIMSPVEYMRLWAKELDQRENFQVGELEIVEDLRRLRAWICSALNSDMGKEHRRKG